VEQLRQQTVQVSKAHHHAPCQVKAGLIGAGNYASRVLVPAFNKAGMPFAVVASGGSVSGRHLAQKQDILKATTDTQSVLTDDEINTVVIATPHHTHARLVVSALEAGKHVFVEKPLALTLDELQAIAHGFEITEDQQLMVGFNRRFSPYIVRMKQELQKISQPKHMVMTVNAGDIPLDHWTQDVTVGGGRIIGEGCHFIDLLRHMAGVPVASWSAEAMQSQSPVPDTVTMTLKFVDGSLGVIHYLANGHRSFAKEKLQVFSGGKILICDNYRSLKAMGIDGFKPMKGWKQDKGQQACAQAFFDLLKNGGDPLIPMDELLEVSRLSIEISQYLSSRSGA
jgi:predicted dehydrogenase